jgi:hypothetical protein
MASESSIMSPSSLSPSSPSGVCREIGSRPYCWTCARRLEHFTELTAKARDVNRRVMQTMQASQDCVLASPAIERIAQPTLTEDGRRARP